MTYSRFETGIVLRVAGLAATVVVFAWALTNTRWYVAISLVVLAAAAQVLLLIRYATRSSREIARFLDAIAFDDTTASFSSFAADNAFAELGNAMGGVLERLRWGRAEREEQSQYLQTLLSHVPVALIAVEENGALHLLNLAARRLFEAACPSTTGLVRFGPAFATGIESLKPGESMIVSMERPSGALHLKAAATEVKLAGTRRRLISLQNIETELTARELAAWQAVIRVMAHEVMNSLTPISSLAATARDIVAGVVRDLAPEAPHRADLADASGALETMARRSEGLLHFVQNHRRLTKRLVVQSDIAPVRRVFARIERLLAGELAARDIEIVTTVEPETLEIAADLELLDQALINLVRNAIEALRDEPAGRIELRAGQDGRGRAVLSVADNGPGIAPDQREKVFVPFFTTKRLGSGVGLTLVRQIATAHGASVGIGETPGGGATVSLRF